MKQFWMAMLVGLALCGGAWAETERVITTTGRGTIDMVPDMATISLGVTHQAREAGTAMSAVSDAVRDVLTRLTAAGIAERDMQTDTLSLQPVWQRNNSNSDTPPRITGFVARNALSIRVRDLDNLGRILDDVVQDGANTFNGLRFSVQDPEPEIAKAREAAVKDAIAKAEQLARAAGVTLGPVQTISENGGNMRPQMMEMAAARMASDMPVAAGEVSLSAQVSMVFAIQD